jgi:hypothetical protein
MLSTNFPEQNYCVLLVFICGLLNDSHSSPDYIVLSDEVIIELRRLWKQAGMG